jgi:octaprenyl-diphosphate synthase
MSSHVHGPEPVGLPLPQFGVVDPQQFHFHERFQEALLRSLSTGSQRIYGITAPLLKSNGKHLRPFLVAVAGSFGNAPPEALVQLAVAVELVHTASLYHDDLIDQSTLRRGKITLHLARGPLTAVLAGDHLLHLATNIIQNIRLQARETERELRDLLARAAADMCKGQIVESLNVGNLDLEEEQYLSIIELKTARLFEASCHAGALVAGAPAEALRAYGRNFGLLYQVVDDLRDILATEYELRRTPGSDLNAGTYTLPVVHVLRSHTPSGQRLREILRRRQGSLSAGDREELLEILASSQATQYALDRGLGFGSLAKTAIDGLPQTEGHAALLHQVDDLCEMITALVRRHAASP